MTPEQSALLSDVRSRDLRLIQMWKAYPPQSRYTHLIAEAETFVARIDAALNSSHTPPKSIRPGVGGE